MNTPSRQTEEVQIHDLARGGKGVGRRTDGPRAGQVVFVPRTLPGDRARVHVPAQTRAGVTFADAELVEITQPSPDRVEPRCAYFGECGGCQWQHVPYAIQWKTKFAGVQSALKRAGVAAPAAGWAEHPAEKQWNYRNRVQLAFQDGALGYFKEASHGFVAIERCDIATPEINATLPRILTDQLARGGRRTLEIRVGTAGDVQWGERGPEQFSFRQVNDEQNEKLRGWIAAQATQQSLLNSETAVLDLFGGDGNLSAPLAAAGVEARICVDRLTKTRVADDGAQFIGSDVITWLREKLKQDGAPWESALAVLDPPRAGLGGGAREIATSLAKLQTRGLFLVGCSADAWAKDLRALTAAGWVFSAGAVFDFFPQTPHVECVALLIPAPEAEIPLLQ